MSWETLRPVLLELCQRDASPLRRPDPRVTGDRRMPVRVVLAPWAESVAARLHADFADEVVLTVGNFGYPDRVPMDDTGRRRDPSEPQLATAAADVVDPSVVMVELGRELVARSGHEAAGELVIANRTPGILELHRPTVTVVDLASGRTVGGSMGRGRSLTGPTPLRLSSGRSGTLELAVSTASLDPQLGYSVPPGDWAIRVLLPVADRRTLRAPLLPIRII